MADILILVLVAIWAAAVIRKLMKDRKNGRCTGCAGGSCSSCHGCDSAYIDELIAKARKEK